MQSFIVKLENQDEELINDGNVNCYLIDSSCKNETLKILADKVHAAGKLLLCSGDKAAEVCKEHNLDGVLLEVNEDMPYKKQILSRREIIGNHCFMGVVCPLQRHAAMIVSETEPDFVAFRIDDEIHAKEIISWYNELFLIQSAVLSGKEECDLRVFDTDFLILSSQEYKNFGC